MFVPVTTAMPIEPLRAMAAVAIDLGFSGSQPTCGVAMRSPAMHDFKSQKVRFGESIGLVAGHLKRFSKTVMIIEAPLSAAFDEQGNPRPRGEFEAKPKPHWWSIGPGAVMALAAQYFLRELRLVAPVGNCFLVEGFVTGEDSGDDGEVANALLNGFVVPGRAVWHTPQGTRLVSVLDWLDDSSVHSSPLVLVPAKQ